jgi:hypothetical protein
MARTPLGRLVELPLEHGAFKKRPNKPERPDGQLHVYCPPEHVAAEMDRLVAVHGERPAECPEVRAAWLHHAFTQIHPFQDGNGRVARALASIDFVRAGLLPVLIERTDRGRYLGALASADANDLSPLVRLFAEAESRVITRAISEAEGAIEDSASLSDIRAAAQSKVAARRQSGATARDAMVQRFEQLLTQCRKQMEETGKALQDGVPTRGYWADLREKRRWALLKLTDGGIVDIVVTLHFVGNPSTGAAVANVFMDHRDVGEGMSSDTQVLLPVEPLRLVPDEGEAAQLQRFRDWVAGALRYALAQWTKYL